MELEDCGTGYQPVRKYTWGLDLAGQSGNGDWLGSGADVPVPVSGAGASERAAQASAFLEAAGGIGGLLAVSDPNDPNDPNDPCGDFVYFYDGNEDMKIGGCPNPVRHSACLGGRAVDGNLTQS